MTKDDMIDTIKAVMNYLYKDVGDTWYGNLLSDVLEELMNSGDAEPVRHGHWIDAYPKIEPNPMFQYGICSVCGYEQSVSKYLKFCPNCGAKMDEVE